MQSKTVKILLGILFVLVLVIAIELGLYFFPKYFKPVRVTSSVKGYSIQTNDSNSLKKLMQETNFAVNSKKQFYNYEEATWQRYTSVVISLTDMPQKYDQVRGGTEKIMISSFGQKLDRNTLYIYVYVNPIYYTDENSFWEVSNNALIRALFLSKKPEYYSSPKTVSNLEELVSQYFSSSIRLLKVSNSQVNVLDSIFAFITKNNPFEVRSALAQSCYGSYECGTSGTLKYCSISGNSCTTCNSACPSGGGTCVCLTNQCLDAGQAAQSCGGSSYAACTGSRCSTSGSCVYSGGCSWDSGGGGGGGGGTISCGTQTCNASTEVCCATGCKPISEGCTVATPTPAPSYTCTVQGLKVVMPGNQNIAPANSQTVTLNDPATSTSTQPYYFFYQSAGKTRTVSVSVPANYTVGYTLCYNDTNCHAGVPVMSSSVNLADNSFCGSSNGYADLWWHYYPPPSCTISFNSPNYSMSVGSSQTAGTNVTFSNGTISSVNFASSNIGIATVNPASDTANPYTTSITGVSGGSSTVTANVIMSGVSRCSATTAVSVTSNPWWQVKDSDVATNQDLRSTVPPGLMFGKNGDGGYPGVAVYGTSTNLTKTNVSATGWLVNTTYSTSKIYDSNYFINSIPGDAVINPVSSSSVAGSFFASGGTAYNGYYWYVYDGTANEGIPLTITTPSAVLGPRKVILIVKGANLSIKGNIKLTKGSGFFLAVAGKNTAGNYGDIIVDPGVGGGGSANLEGIYVADGTFSSGTGGTSQLWVRGTVAAYKGINLQRDLGSATNTTTPAEYFEYAPDQELLFPVDLAYSLTTWREVAP